LAANENFLGCLSNLDHLTYDCVFVSEVIEHLPDESLKGVLSTLGRIVKTGGLLIVTTPDSENLLSASRYCPVCRHLFHPWGHVRSFNAEQLRNVLANYGFECDEIHSVDFSAAREPMEELKKLREVITDMKRDFISLQKESAIEPKETMGTLRRYIELLSEISGPHVPEDPKRRHIGFGGTLVAFARKQPGNS
jgi:2-polyprenyl-3-methyl-5-hydroxy-6-metoxy-1,4-benzoquinol methylase